MSDGDSIISVTNKDYGFGLKKCDLVDSSLSCYMAFPYPNKGEEIRFKQFFDEIQDSKFILYISNHKEKATMQIFFEVDGKEDLVRIKETIPFQKGEFEFDKKLKILTAR